MLVTLDEIKLHLRVDHDAEDNQLEIYASAAEQHIKMFLGSDWSKVESTPAPIKSAILLLIGDLYANREGVGNAQYFRNPTYQILLNPYITKEVY